MPTPTPDDLEFQQYFHNNAPQTSNGLYEFHPDNETKQQYLDRVAKLGQMKFKETPYSGESQNPGAGWASKLRSDPRWGKSFTGVDPTQPSGLNAAGQPQGLDRNAAVNDFYRMMMNPNDPALKAAQQVAQSNSNQNSAAAGLGGGLAASSASKVGQDAFNATLLQRQKMGINALQQGMNYDRGLQSQVFDQNQSNQINQQNNDTRALNAGISVAGQAGSALSKIKWGSGDSAGGGMTGGVDGGMDPGSLNSYDQPAAPDPYDYRGSPSDLSGMGGGI